MSKLTRHQVSQAGEHLVAAELHRRGAYAAMFSGNMPNIDVVASDTDQLRSIDIQVKTKTTGSWHSTIKRGAKRRMDPNESKFWILVDIGRGPEFQPTFHIVPDSWMTNHIFERTRRKRLDERRNPEGNPVTHFGIKPKNVAEWRDRWDLLPIFPTPSKELSHG